MRRLKENSLGLVFGVLFLASLTGQAIAGRLAYNQEQLDHGGDPVSFGHYLTSPDFGQAVMENWQSEYLQFLLFLLLTIWLFQRARRSPRRRRSWGWSPRRSS